MPGSSPSTVSESPRWSADQVLALAPDAAAQRAARGLAGDTSWAETGLSSTDEVPSTLWGLCRGSGKLPYQTSIDLSEPAYRCSCPSRKFPCKHALGLLLRWTGGGVGDAPAPGWVREWHLSRGERAAKAAARFQQRDGRGGGGPGGDGPGGGGSGGGAARVPNEKTRARRADRIAGGLDELERWLADQARTGLAALSKVGYAHWDAVAARLVDAQATGAAGMVRRLAAVAGSPERLLGELALLRLLVAGYRRVDELPVDLAASVRLRAGLAASTEQVLSGPPVRDRWQVLGIRDETEDLLTVRRIWLRGADTGRSALVLSFGGPGQALIADLVLGTEVDADLCFYPGAAPLRALVARRHSAAAEIARRHDAADGTARGPATGSLDDALVEYARALAADPWLERWPVVLDGVVPVRAEGGWHVVAADGAGLPIDPAAGQPWRLVGALGGRPATVVGEWSPAGFRPLTAWTDGRLVRV